MCITVPHSSAHWWNRTFRNELSNVIENYIEEGKDDSSLIFLALDVPKILKNGSKIKFASSPDLSGVGVQENYIKRFKRLKSASTSSSVSITTAKEGEISSNLSKLKNPPTILNSKNKSQDNKGSKLRRLPKPKIATTVRVTTDNNKPTTSHANSAIPKLI